MKVSKATTRVLQTPADNPLVVGVPQEGTREFVTLELDTDEGLQGIGLTFFGGPLTPALKAAVDDLCQMIIGEDPMGVEAISEQLRLAASGAGPEGIFTLALSAIDIALWDINGKALNQSVCSRVTNSRVPSAGYAHTYEFDDLEDFATQAEEIMNQEGPVLIACKVVPNIRLPEDRATGRGAPTRRLPQAVSELMEDFGVAASR